jgi:phosphoribosyl 1,2-cyclic phosphodiesterase
LIRFAMLGSGSKGNATLVECGRTRVLVDCGFNLRETEARLLRLGVEAAALDAIVVTHEHGDHLGGVARLARRHRIPVWLTHGTLAAWRDPLVPEVRAFHPHGELCIGSLQLTPYPVPHDAREPCQYVFSAGGRRLGILSDAGHVTPHMRAVLNRCDALLLECNHDPDLLEAGPYPFALKRRVGGELGHLSNQQAGALLASLDCTALQHLVLTHLSETNNTPALADAAVTQALGRTEPWMVCAGQDRGLDWREIA